MDHEAIPLKLSARGDARRMWEAGGVWPLLFSHLLLFFSRSPRPPPKSRAVLLGERPRGEGPSLLLGRASCFFLAAAHFRALE